MNQPPPNNLPASSEQVTHHTSPTFDNLTPDYGFKWCPGCANFAILNALKFTIIDRDIDPSTIVAVSDIGQNGKLPMWLNVHGFHGLHGRALPLATGVKLANPKLNVLAILGDGGAYSEGTNHLVHAARRNINLTCLVHNNSVFALTTGQASPTTIRGIMTKTTPEGVLERELNPLQLAIASGATFVARVFAGDAAHMQEVIAAGMEHQGFALIDILQPCVIWNKVQTWQSWEKKVKRLDDTHMRDDIYAAFKKSSTTWNDHIPIGIFYQTKQPTLDGQIHERLSEPPVRSDLKSPDVSELLR